MFLGGPDADRVVSQVVREHRDRALEVTLRVGSERGETRELVEDKCLTAVLLGALAHADDAVVSPLLRGLELS